MDAKAIGNRLRKLRGDKTIQCVADAVGVSKSAIAMYELGKRIPVDEVKIKLSEYFGTSVAELFYVR